MKICLNMIVKDEAPVIKRCLNSVKKLIDYWVIVDTGSSDGTQEIIRDFLHDIPGELHERPWVNFAHNRNEALDLARGKGDYFLFIDADDHLVFSDTFTLPSLDKDYYFAIQHRNGEAARDSAINQVVLLLKDQADVRWKGAIHETLISPFTKSVGVLDGVINIYNHDGARSQDSSTHEKDIAMLEQDLEKDPSDGRTVFYLGQTYRALGDYQNALKTYKKRAAMGGQKDEVFASLYCIGLIQKNYIKSEPEVFIKSFSQAFCYRPSRAEPLFQIAGHLLKTENYWLAYLVSKIARRIPAPVGDLFVENWMYDWCILLQYHVACFEIGEHEKAVESLKKLLANPQFPPDLYNEYATRLQQCQSYE